MEPVQTRVNEFDSTHENQETMRRGHVDAEKRETNARIVPTNANSFSHENEEKIDQMIDFCNINKIGMTMTSETNYK